MKRVTPIVLSSLVALCVLVPDSASAQAQQRRVLRPIPTDGGAAPATPTPAPAPVAPAVPAVVDAGAAAVDAGAKEKGKEGPDQRKRRKEYVERVRKEIRTIVPKGQLTEQGRELIRQHWRRSMRTLRVRLLADDENDKAFVARCDAFLAKIDQRLFDQLKGLHKKGGTAAKDGGAK